MLPFIRLPWSRAPSPPEALRPWLLPEFPGVEDADEVERLVPVYTVLLQMHDAPLLEESLALHEVREELRVKREEGTKKLRVKHDALAQKYTDLIQKRARELAKREVYELRHPGNRDDQQGARDEPDPPKVEQRSSVSPKRQRFVNNADLMPKRFVNSQGIPGFR